MMIGSRVKIGWLALGLMALILCACAITPSPMASATTSVIPSLTTSPTDDSPHFPIPENYQCDQELVLEWPVIDQVVPSPASAGTRVEISGHGGAIRCGNAYDESSRDFDVFLDDESVGSINCYVNHCEGSVILPENLEQGSHWLTIGPEEDFALEVQ